MSFIGILQFVVYILILVWVLRKKSGEKFSKKTLARFLVCGIIAALINVFLPLEGDIFFGMNPLAAGFLTAFLAAGLVEEVLKYLMFRLAIFKNKEVGTWLDAMIAAVFVAAGFGMLEDVGYVMGGDANILRAILPMHLLFQLVMGYYYGKARVTGQKKYHVYSLVVPILLHTVFDMFVIALLSIVGDSATLSSLDADQLQNLPYYNYIVPLAAAEVVVVVLSLIALILAARKLSTWKKNGEKQERLSSLPASTEEAT